MHLGKSRVYRETLAAATAFHARRLWEEYGPDECFALIVPGRDRPLFASIVGRGGTDFGLMLTCGEHAYRDMLAKVVGDEHDEDAAAVAAIVGFRMVPLRTIPARCRHFLDAAKFSGDRHSIVPQFMVKEPGKQPKADVNRQTIGAHSPCGRTPTHLAGEGPHVRFRRPGLPAGGAAAPAPPATTVRPPATGLVPQLGWTGRQGENVVRFIES